MLVDDVRVLTDAAAVEVALDPIRASILEAAAEPGSAATVAAAASRGVEPVVEDADQRRAVSDRTSARIFSGSVALIGRGDRG